MQPYEFLKIKEEVKLNLRCRKIENEKDYINKIDILENKFYIKPELISGSSNISFNDIYKIENESNIKVKKIEHKSIGAFDK